MKLEAVKSNPDSIRFIMNPSEKIQLEAVKNSDLAYYYIQNPSTKIYSKWLYYNYLRSNKYKC